MQRPSGERRQEAARASDLIEPVVFRPPGILRRVAWPRMPWLGLAVLATLLGAALVIGYMLLARSVHITTDPAEARVRVAEWLAPRLGAHWLLLPGPRVVRAEAPGYRPYEGPIEIGAADMQTHHLALVPLPGQLEITLAPVATASVSIDGHAAGNAPGRIDEVEAGLRRIAVEAPRYLPFEAEIQVRGKRELERLEVTLLPAWADFAIASTPAGATVAVDGRPLGETPLQGELVQGARELSVSLRGYKPWRRQVAVVAGQPVSIPDVALVPADGVLEIVSNPPGAAVTIDGRFRGEAPLRIAVAPDAAHRVTVMKTGYAPATLEGRAAPDETATLAVQLEPELAVIDLVSVPEDAELLVDGQPAGTATQRLELPTHDHEITVRKRGFATYRTIVTPRRGVEKRMKITLKTAAEMARERTAATPAARTVPPAQTEPPPTPPEGGQFTAEAAEQSALVASVFSPHGGSPAGAPLALGADGIVRSAVGQELKLFAGGEFVASSGKPVRLARPFYLGLREVSNAEYRRFLASHVSRGEAGQNLDADPLPAVGMSWAAAAQYCNWLSRRESLPPFYQIRYGRVLGINPEAVGYRLPTEAEWEWAAGVAPDGKSRGRLQEYPWGSGYPPRAGAGNFADRSAQGTLAALIDGYDDGFAAAAPVGSFAADARGLHDLGGNVAEWAHDVYAEEGPAGEDPLGPRTGAMHAVRGASWRDSDPARLRVAHRAGADAPRPDLGFRLARYAR